MKDLFLSLLFHLLNYKCDITEALMYSSGEFSKFVVETKSGTYSITISKENKTDGNS